MAKVGDKIYFGKLVNAEVDMAWVAGVVADDRSDAIERIKANIDDEEMELITLSVDSEGGFTLFEDMEEDEQKYYKNCDFFLYDPDSLSLRR